MDRNCQKEPIEMPQPQNSQITRQHARWMQAMASVELPASPDFENDQVTGDNQLRPVRDRLMSSPLLLVQLMRQREQRRGGRHEDGILDWMLRGAKVDETDESEAEAKRLEAESSELGKLVISFSIHAGRPSNCIHSPLQKITLTGASTLKDLTDHIYCLAQHYQTMEWDEQPPSSAAELRHPPRTEERIEETEVWTCSSNEFHQLPLAHSLLDWFLPTAHPADPLLLMHHLPRFNRWCSHIIIIQRVSIEYGIIPRVQSWRAALRRTKCRCCDVFLAQWLIHGDPQLPELPAHLCHRCVSFIYYDEEGRLRPGANFTIIPYYHEL